MIYLMIYLEYFKNAFIYGIDIGVSDAGPRYKVIILSNCLSNSLFIFIKKIIYYFNCLSNSLFNFSIYIYRYFKPIKVI